MTARALFGVVVRLSGLYWIVSGFQMAVGTIMPAEGFTAQDYLLGGVPAMVAGLALMLMPNVVVTFCYGRPPPQEM